MENIQIAKTKWGLTYKIWANNMGDTRFPPEIKTAQQMREFFRKGLHTRWPGNYPEPKITFVDSAYKNPVNYYTVRRGTPYTVALCNFDKDKRILFDFRADTVEYLKKYVSDEVLTDAEKITELDSKIEFLKRSASEETLKELEDLIAAKNSDAGLINTCKDHAKKFYNSDAIIEFID